MPVDPIIKCKNCKTMELDREILPDDNSPSGYTHRDNLVPRCEYFSEEPLAEPEEK